MHLQKNFQKIPVTRINYGETNEKQEGKLKSVPDMKQHKLTLSILKSIFGICRLNPGSEIPAWAYEGSFFSITKTPEELSFVCPENSIPVNLPENVRAERSWSCLKVEGPLNFGLTGILAGLSRILADNEISIFAISTYDTDYILLKEKNLKRAVRALEEAGYKVIEEVQNET